MTITKLVWGSVPDEAQRDELRNAITRTIHGMKPPMPPRYADDLVKAVMKDIEGWDWWQQRWYGVHDD